MKSLDNLIRLHRWELNEKRRQLEELRAMEDDLRARARRLDEEVAREAQLAAARPEDVGRDFPAYAAAARVRRDRLGDTIGDVARQAEAAADAVNEAFQQVKKYELTAENRRQRERRRENQRAQIALDEIALNMFRRRTRSAR